MTFPPLFIPASFMAERDFEPWFVANILLVYKVHHHPSVREGGQDHPNPQSCLFCNFRYVIYPHLISCEGFFLQHRLSLCRWVCGKSHGLLHSLVVIMLCGARFLKISCSVIMTEHTTFRTRFVILAGSSRRRGEKPCGKEEGLKHVG